MTINQPLENIRGCPFCRKSGGHVQQLTNTKPEFAVHCPDCGGRGPVEMYQYRAIMAWNRSMPYYLIDSAFDWSRR